jgi:hypothetical protein
MRVATFITHFRSDVFSMSLFVAMWLAECAADGRLAPAAEE